MRWIASAILALTALLVSFLCAAAPPPGTPASPDPAIGTSKPDAAAMHCALAQYIPWVRAQGRPVDPDLKAKKLQEIDKACGSSLHLSKVTTAYDSPANATQEPKQPVTAGTSAAGAATTPGPNLPALVRSLSEELQKPEYFESRCMLAPLFAADKRFIAMSRDDTFRAGDKLLAINGESLNPASDRAAHELLVRYPPNATVTVRVLRAGTEVDIAAPCVDSRQYYAVLRAAVTAGMQDDAASCADRMHEAGQLHALASAWLNVGFNCDLKAGRINGAPALAEYFVIYHQVLLENDFSPGALQKVRPSLQNAAQKLLDAGSRPLAEKLQQEYAGEVTKFSPLQGSALALQLTARSPVSAPAGVAQEPPRVSVTQDGKVTNLTVAGQLAAKHPVGCVPLESVDNTRTPPDLYIGVSTCIQKNDYHAAAALFALAGIDSRFDAERVLDKSAGQAGQVLIMGTFNAIPDDKRKEFQKTITELNADPAALAQICRAVQKIGYPTYFPEYMVLHGINAFTAKPGDATLVADFDAPVTWNFLLTNYLTCRDVSAPPPTQVATVAKDDVRSNDPNRMKPGMYQVKTNAVNQTPGESNTGPTYMRMCFTPAMINAANPVPAAAQCDELKVIRKGNATYTDFNCSKDGTSSQGRNEETVDGDKRNAVLDISTTDKTGAHKIHLETEMIFLGPDCNAAYASPPAAISVRHYHYESSLKGDDRSYQLKAEYECRLEGDSTAAFNQLEWRLQGGMNRLKLVGKLSDGSAFKVQPLHMNWRIWDKNAGTCPDSSKTVDSEIWITTAGSQPQIERFDSKHLTSNHHKLQSIESKLVLDKSDSVPPGTPGLKPPPYVENRPQYYTVEMISVPAASVTEERALKEFTEQKHIPWLSAGQAYPFTAWSDDDVTFARNYTGIFTTEDDRRGGPGTDAEGLKTYYALPSNSEWRIDREHRDLASQWLLMPDRKDADKNVPRPDPKALTKIWIVYEGARIEIPLFNYYRVLYDPQRDEYVQFSIERRDVD